ncbi:MAG: hypothetical protein IBX45_09475 [Campylobacterales bacterium]|nr:hypothetical protein [Campylobacterales bacterium]
MNSKITLYADQNLIDGIKSYAKKHNTSVSKLVMHFFESTLKHENPNKTIPSKTSKLQGVLKGKVSEEEYAAYLEKKHA